MWAVITGTAIVGLGLVLQIAQNGGTDSLTTYFFKQQDVLVLAAIVLALLLIARLPDLPFARFGDTPVSRRFWPFATALLLAAACYAGHHLLLSGYSLTRDEQMADFDAYIWAHGKLFWEVPLQWREGIAALNHSFMLPITGNVAWVSNYLPGNALLRMLVGRIADPALTSPVLVAIGAIALSGVIRRIWPDRNDAVIIGLLLYAGSSQIVLTGMMAYAMTAHLAFNLCWLWLFLMNKRKADVAALAIGFLATGLHQPIFHPLFVLPFFAIIFMGRDWRRLALFCAGYAAICLFWACWPIWINSLATPAHTGHAPAGVDFWTRAMMAITSFNALSLWLMALNMMRLIAWQHILLFPLILLGLNAVRGGDQLARALLAGILLPIFASWIILPYQGHGWGYRYVHGVLGNFILLGVYGWCSLSSKELPVARRAMTWGSGATLTLVAVHAVMVHNFYAPYAALARQISSSKADMAMVEMGGAPFMADVVLNRPDLANRPIRLIGELTPDAVLQSQCRQRKSMIVVSATVMQPVRDVFGLPAQTPAGEFTRKAQLARSLGCFVKTFP